MKELEKIYQEINDMYGQFSCLLIQYSTDASYKKTLLKSIKILQNKILKFEKKLNNMTNEK